MFRLIRNRFAVVGPVTSRSRKTRSDGGVASTDQGFPSIDALGRRLMLLTLLVLLNNAHALAQSADETVVAVVDGQEITQRHVDNSMSTQIYPLKRQLSILRKVALENLIIERVLENEASRRRISVDELRKELMAGEVKVTQPQVEDAYAQNASFFAAMNKDEAKARLRLDLENQARMRHYKVALEKLKQAGSIRVLNASTDASVGNDDVKSPSLGSKEAVVTIVEYSDFECPFCKMVQPTLKEILSMYEGRINLTFKHLPSEGHRYALVAARAANCAAEQDRFWQFHDAVFASADRSPEALKTLAQNLGLATDRFQSCLSSEQSLTQVLRDAGDARNLGINSTPSFVINGRIVSGAISLTEFRRVIDEELQRTGSLKRSSMN
jgi:protein-disulfide isomerase